MIKQVITTLIYILLLFTIAVNVFSYFNLSLFGFRVYRISSGSMSPTMEINDLILVQKSNKYYLDDIVTYENNGEYITHRIIRKESGRYITKGDNNNIEDSDVVTKDNIVGRCIFIMSIARLLSKTNMLYCIIGIGVLMLILMLIPDKKEE